MDPDKKQRSEKAPPEETPPVHKVPDKKDVPQKPQPKENPSGDKDNRPEEQISG